MYSYVLCVVNYVKWIWNFLLHFSFFSHVFVPDFPETYEQVSGITFCTHSPDSETDDCAVCLSKIEEGDEMRELRCRHVFHRDCLDRWVAYNHDSCPLCRRSLVASLGTAIGEVGMEVITFRFCSFRSNERENWWLR